MFVVPVFGCSWKDRRAQEIYIYIVFFVNVLYIIYWHHSMNLKLILIFWPYHISGIGLICCILRILFCICPSQCISSSRRKLKKKNAKVDADHTTSLLRGDSKRVSIARGPQVKISIFFIKKSNVDYLFRFSYDTQNQKPREHTHDVSEGMEALRQIATTSLFLQNEQHTSTKSSVPIIKEPDKPHGKHNVTLGLKHKINQNHQSHIWTSIEL